MKTSCPFCKYDIELTDSMINEWVNCPNKTCGKKFLVEAKCNPEIETTTPSYQKLNSEISVSVSGSTSNIQIKKLLLILFGLAILIQLNYIWAWHSGERKLALFDQEHPDFHLSHPEWIDNQSNPRYGGHYIGVDYVFGSVETNGGWVSRRF